VQRGKFKPIVPKDKRKKAAEEEAVVKAEPEDDGAFKDLMRAVSCLSNLFRLNVQSRGRGARGGSEPPMFSYLYALSHV